MKQLICRLFWHRWTYGYEKRDVRAGETRERWIRHCSHCGAYQGRYAGGDLIDHVLREGSFPQREWRPVTSVWQERSEWERAMEQPEAQR